MKKVLEGWTTESAWNDEHYPDLGGAIELLGAFTTQAGYWEPFERMVKLRITIEEIAEGDLKS